METVREMLVHRCGEENLLGTNLKYFILPRKEEENRYFAVGSSELKQSRD